MPIAVTLPTIAPDPTKTIVGQKCIFAFLPTAGTQENYLGKITFSRSVSKLQRKVPDTDGSLIPDRTVITEKTITAKITLDEFTTDSVKFLNNAQRVGTGRIWIKDPADAANTAALLSNEFNCTLTMEGDLSTSQDAFSEFTVTIDINGTFTLTNDGSTTT